jgi:hypothetical protein
VDRRGRIGAARDDHHSKRRILTFARSIQTATPDAL